MQALSAVIAANVRLSLGSLRQARCMRDAHMTAIASQLAEWPQRDREAAIDALAGFSPADVDVLVHEARGLRHPSDTARGVVQTKLLQRAPARLDRSIVEAFAPIGRALLSQGRLQLDEILLQRARAARSAEGAAHPWLQLHPDLHFVRFGPGNSRVGLALIVVSPGMDEAAAPAAQEAQLALCLAAHAAVSDGVLPGLPESLFVAEVEAPMAHGLAPLMAANGAVARAITAAAIEQAGKPAAPVRLRLFPLTFDARLVRDALGVADGVWERCVLGGAVPQLPAKAEGAIAMEGETRKKATELAALAVSLRACSDALALRMALVQGEVERQVLSEGFGFAGTMELGPASIEATERLDLHRAAAELERRGCAALDYCQPVYDVDAMRGALEGFGVDTRGFVAPGRPDESRVRALLGDEVALFTERRVLVTLGAQRREASFHEHIDALADEVVAGVTAEVDERMPRWLSGSASFPNEATTKAA